MGFDLIFLDQFDQQNAPNGYLKQDINEGVQSRTRNFLKPVSTNNSSLAATSFYLDVDSNCESSNEFKDVTNGSILHCDCRYLVPNFSQDKNEKPITEIYFSKTHSQLCTDDINENRTSNFSLYLCWRTAPGKDVCHDL